MDLDKSRKDWKQGLMFGTIIVGVIIISMWTINIISKEFKLQEKVIMTIAGIVILVLAWIMFSYQQKIDSKKVKENGLLYKTFKVTNIVHGIDFKIRFILWLIGSIIGFLFGIYLLITEKNYWWIGIIIAVVSLLGLYVARNFWNWSKTKMKGRYY